MQMVWIRLECPQDASVKGLRSAFFMEFDRITSDNAFATTSMRPSDHPPDGARGASDTDGGFWSLIKYRI